MDLLYRLGSNGAVNELVKEVLGDTENPVYVHSESSTEAFFKSLRQAGEDDARRARGSRLCPIDWLVGLPSTAPEQVCSEACSRLNMELVAFPISCLGLHAKADIVEEEKPVYLSMCLCSNASQ